MPIALPDSHVIKIHRKSKYDWNMIFDGTGRGWLLGEEVPKTFATTVATKAKEMVNNGTFRDVKIDDETDTYALVDVEIGKSEDGKYLEIRGVWEYCIS